MAAFEDHFSEFAREYAKNRPRYPGELFAYLVSIAPDHELAWDCGTGNGQAAQELVKYFDRVVATDASKEQISQAIAHERIDYQVARAEEVKLEPHSVDLITVALAVHWFDLEPFYQVVRRVGRPDGIFAVWMYHLPVIDPDIDPILEHYYTDVLSGYWPERFHFIADHYQTLIFPFDELEPPKFEMQADWALGQLVGFLDSWSATRRYQNEHGSSPINLIWQDLSAMWGEPSQRHAIHWPIYPRVGRIG